MTGGRPDRLVGTVSAALSRYAIGEYRLTRLAESFNTVYRADTARHTFVLRVGPHDRIHPVDAVRAEGGWTRRLGARGFTVPQLVPTADRAGSVHLDGRECSLWTWVPGRPLERPATQADVQQLAALSARLHEASPPVTDMPPGALSARSVRYFDVPDLLAELPRPQRAVLQAARDRAQDAVDRLWRNASDPPRLIHGDLTPSNVVREGDEMFAIDFQDLAWGHVEQDLAHSIYGVTRGDDLAGGLTSFRAGYEHVRPWPDLDVELLSDLVAARRVSMVNMAITRKRADLDNYVARHAAALLR